MKPLKALSLYQPWASLIAHGYKRIETRSWSTSYRGLLAIHATGEPRSQQVRDIISAAYQDDAISSAMAAIELTYQQLPKGAIVAICTLVSCEPTESIARRCCTTPWFNQESRFGDYSPGRYGFRLHTVRTLPQPVPARGLPSLWTVPPDALRAIEEQIGPLRDPIL